MTGLSNETKITAKEVLDKVLYTRGQESLKAYRELASLIATQEKLLPALRFNALDLLDISVIAARETVADLIQQGLGGLNTEPGATVKSIFATAENLIREFSLAVPENWQNAIVEGKKLADLSAVFENVNNTIDALYLTPAQDWDTGKHDRLNAVYDLLGEVGNGVALLGDASTDKAAVAEKREAVMKNIPTFTPDNSRPGRTELIAEVLSGIVRDVLKKTGHERYIALEELTETAHLIGIQIGKRSPFENLRISAKDLKALSNLAILELLDQEVQHLNMNSYDQVKHLRDVGTKLLDGLASQGKSANGFRSVFKTAKSILGRNVSALFAKMAEKALAEKNLPPSFSTLMQTNGYEPWTINHIHGNGHARECFLKRIAPKEPELPWDVVRDQLAPLRQRVLESVAL